MDEGVFPKVVLVPDEATFKDLGAGGAGPAIEAARRTETGTLTAQESGALHFAGRKGRDFVIDEIAEVGVVVAGEERGPYPVAIRLVHGPDAAIVLFTDGRLTGNRREWASALVGALTNREPSIQVGPER